MPRNGKTTQPPPAAPAGDEYSALLEALKKNLLREKDFKDEAKKCRDAASRCLKDLARIDEERASGQERLPFGAKPAADKGEDGSEARA